MQLATIGYEGASLADFVATLIRAGIKRVIDVREIAQSRRPGFSKSAFSAALNAADIEYHHIRQLGDPKHGREAARAGKMDLFRHIFSAHMELTASQNALREALQLATEEQAVLVCYERDPKDCHRTIVAAHLAALGSFETVHLGVQPGSQRMPTNARSAERVAGAC